MTLFHSPVLLKKFCNAPDFREFFTTRLVCYSHVGDCQPLPFGVYHLNGERNRPKTYIEKLSIAVANRSLRLQTHYGLRSHQKIMQNGYRVTWIKLHKGGAKYNAYFLTNNKISLNLWTVHSSKAGIHEQKRDGYNHCFVDNTSIEDDGYEAALQVLEQINATVIVMEYSGVLGAINFSKAIVGHEFKKGVKYYYRAKNLDQTVSRITSLALHLSGIYQCLEKAGQKLFQHNVEEFSN